MPPLASRSLLTRWRLALVCVFAIALALRLWVVVQLLQPPQLLTLLDADSEIYWRWSAYLREHGPIGRHPFFMAPLYPYALALARSFLGDSIVRIVLLQCIGGACSAVLVTDAVARLSGRRAAIVIGLLFAGYGMALLMDVLILAESLTLLLECLLLWTLICTDWDEPGVPRLVSIGLLIGLLALGRATAVALIVLPVVVLISRTGPRGSKARNVAIVVGCVTALALPALWRNHRVSGEWIPYTYNLGFNFYVGNGPGAHGSYEVPTELGDFVDPVAVGADGGVEADGRRQLRQAYGKSLGPSASSKFWMRLATDAIARDPGRWAGLLSRKAAMVWNAREFSQIYGIALLRRQAGLLGWPWIGTFAVLAPLAFAGVARAWRIGSQGRMLIGYAAIVTLSCAAFFVVDRYRIHLVPSVAILAGLGVAQILDRRPRIESLTLLAAGSALVAMPLQFAAPPMERWGTAVGLGDAWLRRGNAEAARSFYEEAIAIADRGLAGGESSSGRRALAAVYTGYGETLFQLGRNDAAIAAFERGVQLTPRSRILCEHVAQVQAIEGRLARSLELFREAGCDARCAAITLVSRAAHAVERRDSTEATRALTAATALDPANEAAWVALVRLTAARGRAVEAEQNLERARNAGLRRPVYDAHLSLLALMRGDRSGALRARRRVTADESHDPRLEPLVAYIDRELARP